MKANLGSAGQGNTVLSGVTLYYLRSVHFGHRPHLGLVNSPAETKGCQGYELPLVFKDSKII